MNPKPPKFAWPPRLPGLSPAPASPPESASLPASNPLAPPAAPAGASGTPLAPDAPRRADIATVWHAIEATWLGRSRAPLPLRLADAGWSPDLPVAYCGRCGSTCGPFEGGLDGCTSCRPLRLAWDRAVRLGEYRGVLREIIHDIKFTRWRRLGHDMGRLLGASLLRRFELECVAPDSAVLVPVPTSFFARIGRGIDHTLAIVRGMATETGLPVAEVLVRRHRRSQTAVPASERWSNVADAIRCESVSELSGRTVVIVDDIRTTGATLTASCRAMDKAWKARAEEAEDAPLAVWVATLAVARRGLGRGGTPSGGAIPSENRGLGVKRA